MLYVYTVMHPHWTLSCLYITHCMKLLDTAVSLDIYVRIMLELYTKNLYYKSAISSLTLWSRCITNTEILDPATVGVAKPFGSGGILTFKN